MFRYLGKRDARISGVHLQMIEHHEKLKNERSLWLASEGLNLTSSRVLPNSVQCRYEYHRLSWAVCCAWFHCQIKHGNVKSLTTWVTKGRLGGCLSPAKLESDATPSSFQALRPVHHIHLAAIGLSRGRRTRHKCGSLVATAFIYQAPGNQKTRQRRSALQQH